MWWWNRLRCWGWEKDIRLQVRINSTLRNYLAISVRVACCTGVERGYKCMDWETFESAPGLPEGSVALWEQRLSAEPLKGCAFQIRSFTFLRNLYGSKTWKASREMSDTWARLACGSRNAQKSIFGIRDGKAEIPEGVKPTTSCTSNESKWTIQPKNLDCQCLKAIFLRADFAWILILWHAIPFAKTKV